MASVAGRSLRLYFARLPRFVLTAALVLVPAEMLAGGIWFFYRAATSEVAGAPVNPRVASPVGPGAASGQTPLLSGGPVAPPGESARSRLAVRPAGDVRALPAVGSERDGKQPQAPEVRTGLEWAQDALVALAIFALLFYAVGLLLAATVRLVGPDPGDPWDRVGERFGAVGSSLAASAGLVCLGLVCGVLPGLMLLCALAFVVPVAVAEGTPGRAALRRSVALFRPVWAPALLAQLILWGGLGLAGWLGTRLAPESVRVGQPLLASAIASLLLPPACIALVLLYRAARLHPARARQYSGRISAPG